MRYGPIFALLLGGCVNIDARNDGGRGRAVTLIGVTRVVFPDRKGAVSAVDSAGVGFGWDAGPWLGWHASHWVSADPADCSLLVVIRSAAEAHNAEHVLAALGGQSPCIVDHTGTLPH